MCVYIMLGVLLGFRRKTIKAMLQATTPWTASWSISWKMQKIATWMVCLPSRGFFTLSSSVWKEIFRRRPNWHTQGEPTPMIRIACAPGVRQMAGMCQSGTTGGMQPGEQPLAVTHRGGHRALCMICQEGKMKGSCRRICSISAIWV